MPVRREEAPLSFYRDEGGNELDGLLVRDRTFYSLRIKKKPHWDVISVMLLL